MCSGAGREAGAWAIVESMTDEENLPVLIVSDAIIYTDDERLLVDGQPVAPGRYRLQLGNAAGKMPVLRGADH